MPDTPPSYEELERRCLEAEEMLRVIRSGEADTVLGVRGALVVRLAEAEEHAAHIKQVLLAIRNVNQLIVQETDPQQLIERACACLTETLGYFNAWVALLDEDGLSVSATAGSGFQFGFDLLRKQIEEGDFVDCMQAALACDELVIVSDPTADCKDCPLACTYAGRAGLVRCLSFGGRKWGVLAVSVPALHVTDKEEQELFDEVAGDLAFALHRIEMEAQRNATEDFLARQKNFMQTILQTARDGFWVIDGNGQFMEMNEAYCRMSGYTRDELLRLGVNDIDANEKPEETATRIRNIIENGSDLFDTRHRRKDGTVFDVEVSVTWIPDEGGQMVCFARDITDRKHAQKLTRTRMQLLELAASSTLEATMRGALDIIGKAVESPIGFFHFIEPDQETIVLQSWSTETQRTYCKVPGKGLHYSIQNAGVWADCVRAKRPIIHNDYASLPNRRGLPEGHANVVCELVVPVLRDGQVVAVLGVGNKDSDYTEADAGVVSYLADVVWEVVQHKRAEEALQRVRHSVDNMADSMLWVDASGAFLDVNDAACLNLGYTRAELFSMSVSDIDPQFPAEMWDAHWTEMLERGKMVIETEHRKKDGTSIPVELVIHNQVFGDDRFNCIQARDISAHKIAFAALRESEERFRMLIEAAPVAVLAMREGRYVFGNLAAARMLGFDSPAIFMGMDVMETIAPEFREQVTSRMRSMVAGSTNPPMEMQLIRADGTRMWSLSTSVSIVLDGLSTVLIVGQDITARKEAEEAQHESEERYRTLVNHMQDVVWRVDRKGLYTFVSPAAGLMGRDPASLIGKPFDYVLTENSARVCKEAFARRLSGMAGDKPVIMELEFAREDGSTFIGEMSSTPLFDSENRVVEIVGITRDITERRAAEAALRESEERYRTLVNHMQDVVWRVDSNGVLTFVSPTATQFGRRPEDILGKPFEFVLTEESAKLCRESLRNRRDGLLGTQPLALELEHVRSDGSTFISETRTTPVFDDSGDLAEIVGITRDITWRLQAEEAQARLEEQFRQSQKMEAIGQLTGGVAHDFNNLLQVINGGTDLALSELDEEHPAVESLREVARAGERAAWLVGQLLLFSRRQIMRPATLDLNESVAELLKMLRRVIGEHIRVEWVPGRGIGSVHADRGMIEQALMNLCVNARDAMPGGGVLTIETQGVLLDSEYCDHHTWATPGRFVLLSVTDTGSGMDHDTLDHIFEPFFTTKEEGKGTGLGLATVYGIAQQHGGMVTTYSEPGKGSTFRVYLPECERQASEVGTLITGPAKGGTETLLIAEDDETVRRLARRVLERAGYTIITASDGHEAVALFREHMDQISMVILDVVMPGMGGGEAYDRMRELRPDLKALFASGYSEDAIHTNFVLHKGLRLIQKPYAIADLLRTLRALLDGDDKPEDSAPE